MWDGAEHFLDLDFNGPKGIEVNLDTTTGLHQLAPQVLLLLLLLFSSAVLSD